MAAMTSGSSVVSESSDEVPALKRWSSPTQTSVTSRYGVSVETCGRGARAMSARRNHHLKGRLIFARRDWPDVFVLMARGHVRSSRILLASRGRPNVRVLMHGGRGISARACLHGDHVVEVPRDRRVVVRPEPRRRQRRRQPLHVARRARGGGACARAKGKGGESCHEERERLSCQGGAPQASLLVAEGQ